MDFLLPSEQRRTYITYPQSIYGDLESSHYFMPPGLSDNHDTWVTARFSPHWSQEHILYMGDDPGYIGVFDVRKFHDRTIPLEERQLHFFQAHEGAIMDVVAVPQKESHVVTISGDSTIKSWDLNQTSLNRKSHLFHGHEGSVRSICFASDNPNIFVTGGRDSQVKIWDTRVSAVKKGEVDCRMAVTTYKSAHAKQSSKPKIIETPKSRAKRKVEGYKVTSVIFLDEYHVASASENTNSGIRVWDIRKPPRNGEGNPSRVLKIPTSNKKSYGVTCLTLDRFSNRLFAACTDSSIFEYSIPAESISPINSYTGATIHNFYTQLACSPTSDAIACGSEDGRAVIWDLQDQYSDKINRREAQFQQWSCGGHLNQVLNVGWSSRGRYFMSCDEGGVRIWTEPKHRKPWKLNEEDSTQYPYVTHDLGLAYESAKPFELKKSDTSIGDGDADLSCFDSISLSPRLRVESGGIGSPQINRGAKRPIVVSPFKSICSNSPKPLRLNKPPIAKMFKLSSSPSYLQQINSNNQSLGHLTPQEVRFTRKKRNPFFYDHPTENLPNFVYDTFVKKMVGELSTSEFDNSSEKIISKTGKKRIEEWWQSKGENLPSVTRTRLPSVSEFGDSACSKVITENERIALLSPRKIVVKSSSFQSPSMLPPSTIKSIPMTPKKPTDKRPTSRNLFHYFKK